MSGDGSREGVGDVLTTYLNWTKNVFEPEEIITGNQRLCRIVNLSRGSELGRAVEALKFG